MNVILNFCQDYQYNSALTFDIAKDYCQVVYVQHPDG